MHKSIIGLATTLLLSSFGYAETLTSRISTEISPDHVTFRYDTVVPRQAIHSQTEFSYHERNDKTYGYIFASGLGLKELLNEKNLFSLGIRGFYNSFQDEYYGVNVYGGFSNSALKATGFAYNTQINASPSILNNSEYFINDIRGEVGYKLSQGNNVYVGYRNQSYFNESFETFHDSLYLGFSFAF